MKYEEKTAIVSYLEEMACALQQEDVIDFALLAQYYLLKTPMSFKTETYQSFFGLQAPLTNTLQVSTAFCLPVSINELGKYFFICFCINNNVL